MWLVHVDNAAYPHRLLGIINYELGRSRSPYGPLLTPIYSGHMTLATVLKMFGTEPLPVFGSYRSGLYPQLATVQELQASRGYTGCAPTVIETDSLL